ncbi:MAG: hypothetical protein Sapg2KO_38300 [Saprospiraceae bacterium]
MVLQREIPIPVWGTASAGALVEVTLHHYTVRVKSDPFGAWEVSLPAMKAGGAYELTITAEKETIQIKDIYIGEVWICSGQSNMEWALQQSTEGEIEIPKANFPLIRLFHLKKKHDTYKTPYSKEQLEAFSKGQFFHQAKWEVCSPETAALFSGVGYFFGKTLQDSLNVPIGLIQAAVGGSPAQSWVSKPALASHPQMRHLVDSKHDWLNSTIIHPWLAERAKQNWANWEKTKDTPLPGHPFAPNYLFDSALNSLAPYALRGAIWYQGESNATHPSSYPAMMELMLKSWRDLWRQGDFPFYFVQLPRIGNRNLWPEFRAAQQQGLSIPNTGMVVTLDQGHPTDVHPRAKKVVGLRLAHLALAKTYHKNILAESPILSSHHWDKTEHKIVLRVKNAFDGLSINNGPTPKGIYLQGYLKQGSLEAIIEPDKIQLTKDEIIIFYSAEFLPVKVKYAWAAYPENNLINSAGLPLAPFKIDLEGLN